MVAGRGYLRLEGGWIHEPYFSSERTPVALSTRDTSTAAAIEVAALNGHAQAAEAAAAPPMGGRPPALAKRVLDVVIAILLLLALTPLMLLVAVLIKVDSPGPVFFRQRRLGRGMAPFTLIKFRTMHHGASAERHREYIAQLAREAPESTSEELKKLTDDPRITSVGRILRRISIDELPQLFNVLAGQMSLVGPRPALEYEIEHYEGEHFDRFRVRPGLTGLWQVSGRNRLGFNEMLDLDAEYARSASLTTDFKILARTPGAAIRHAA